jgi:hypothetical protein
MAGGNPVRRLLCQRLDLADPVRPGLAKNLLEAQCQEIGTDQHHQKAEANLGIDHPVHKWDEQQVEFNCPQEAEQLHHPVEDGAHGLQTLDELD